MGRPSTFPSGFSTPSCGVMRALHIPLSSAGSYSVSSICSVAFNRDTAKWEHGYDIKTQGQDYRKQGLNCTAAGHTVAPSM